jgi:uncharacterized membrane protein YfcA
VTALWLVLGGLVAGGVGALLGIGGGLLLVPFLNLVFDVPLPAAAAVSLACVTASSSAAGGVYVQEQLADLRLGMTLEMATVSGAIGGTLLASRLPQNVLRLGLAAFLVYVAVTLAFRREPTSTADEDGGFTVHGWPAGLSLSALAGVLSGALGIGGGPLKVPAMYFSMGVPFRVATATSNLMIGVTAAAGAFLYWQRGQLDLALAAPAVVGVYAGARLGARIMPHARGLWLRRGFAVALAVVCVELVLAALRPGSGP